MIADKNNSVEGFIDALHHPEGSRSAADEFDPRIENLQVKILAIVVVIGNQYFCRTRFERAGYCSIHLLRHHSPEFLILAATGHPLHLPCNHAIHTLHVGREIDFECFLLCSGLRSPVSTVQESRGNGKLVLFSASMLLLVEALETVAQSELHDPWVS